MISNTDNNKMKCVKKGIHQYWFLRDMGTFLSQTKSRSVNETIETNQLSSYEKYASPVL